MNFSKIHHWAMMGAMILMGAGAALATHGAATNFLHIAWGYVKHIVVGGFEALGPGLKAMSVATGNLLSMFGVKTGLAVVDPAMMSQLQGAHAAHMGGATAMTHGTSMTAAPLDPGTLTQHFSSRSEWFNSLGSDLQEQFRQQAGAFGKSLADVTADYCNSNGMLVPAAW